MTGRPGGRPEQGPGQDGRRGGTDPDTPTTALPPGPGPAPAPAPTPTPQEPPAPPRAPEPAAPPLPDHAPTDQAPPVHASAHPPGTESPGTHPSGAAGFADGLRFAFGTLTVFPVAVPRWDRQAARAGMLCAPFAGLVVGLCAAAAGGLPLVLGSGSLLAAVAATATGAVLTRGLHLDGLADTADGLGSGKPAGDALRVMKQSDIGPFGVLTLVLVLLAQVAALARIYDGSWAAGTLAAVLAATTARLALTLAARAGVPPARPEGLGAAVARTVPEREALLAAAGAVIAAGAAGAFFDGYAVVRCALAVVLACGTSGLLLRHCERRFGGVTGDVFGAVAETAATTALVVLTFGRL